MWDMILEKLLPETVRLIYEGVRTVNGDEEVRTVDGDINGDGIPDYMQDDNGDGIPDWEVDPDDQPYGFLPDETTERNRRLYFFPKLKPKPKRPRFFGKNRGKDKAYDKTGEKESPTTVELEKYLVMLYCIIAFTIGRREKGVQGKIEGYRSFFWVEVPVTKEDPDKRYGKIRDRPARERPQDEKVGKGLIKEILTDSGSGLPKLNDNKLDIGQVELFYPVVVKEPEVPGSDKEPVSNEGRLIDHTKPGSLRGDGVPSAAGVSTSGEPPKSKQPKVAFDTDWTELKKTDAKNKYKRFCNWSFQVFLEWMFHWFKKKSNIRIYDVLEVVVNGLVTRDTALELSKMNLTGTPISFPILRPMIGRNLDAQKFQKERNTHPTKKIGRRAVGKAVIGTATTITKAVLGINSADDEKMNDAIVDVVSAGGRFLLQSGDSQESIIYGVVRNEMRGFLVRTRDVIGILSNITDELTRQQRDAEMRMREIKRSIRQNFNRDHRRKIEIISEDDKVLHYKEAQFRSGTKAIASNLMNEVLDVSVHISLGYYYIYKIWSELMETVSTTPERRNEDIGDVRENPGELEIMHSMMWYFEDESSSNALYEFLKTSARKLGNKDYVEQLKFAFRSYEQDLRDGIQDVELALSAYRMRIDAENELFNLVAINGLTIKKIGSPKTFAASAPGPPRPLAPGPPRPLAPGPDSDLDSGPDSDLDSDSNDKSPVVPPWPTNGF